MGELFSLLLVGWIVVTMINAAGKRQRKAANPKHVVLPEQEREVELPKMSDIARQLTETEQPQAASAAAGQPEQMMIPDLPPAAPEKPTVAPHVHVTKETDKLFAGSMNAVSTEGVDPCHEEELQEARARDGETLCTEETQGGLKLDFSGSGLAQAFVMQEILNRRPCGRR